METDAILLAMLIFALRIVNSAMFTVRLVLLTRHRRGLAAILAFIEAVIFAVVVANVINDLSEWQNLLAYAGGFAVGNYLGLMLEERFITSYKTANIIAQNGGHEIALALREAGYGVTETIGEGKDGEVTMLRSVVVARDVPKLIQTIRAVNQDAFVALEEAQAVHRGWIRAARGHRR